MPFRIAAPLGVIAAFAALYVIWGSTYLAIEFAIVSMPPFFALGTRFGAAALLLYAWLHFRGSGKTSGRETINALLVGALTAGVGTGTVAWAEQYLTSGFVALIVTSVPIWMVLLDWKWLGGGRPAPQVVAGLVLGLAGIVLLVGPVFADSGVNAFAAAIVLGGSISWSVGSLYGKRIAMPTSAPASSAIQMFGAAIILMMISGVSGEFGRVDASAVTVESFVGWAYLVVFGSIVAFSAYVWLLEKASPKQVSSYAYVNPVVAVFLGWMIADEVVTGRTVAAVAVLVTAVVLVVRYGAAKGSPKARVHAIAAGASPDRRFSRRKLYSDSEAGEVASSPR